MDKLDPKPDDTNEGKFILNFKSSLGILSFFLWPHLQYMDVPGLGVELQLQLQAYDAAVAKLNPESTEWEQRWNQYPHWHQMGS